MVLQPLPRVLIVDDDPDIRAFVADAIALCSADRSVAANAHAALNAIESGCYDIVISDICMPGAPGVELLRIANESQWDLAIVLMTGNPQVPDLVNSIRRHAYDFLLKPFSVDQLLDCVKRTYANLVAARQNHALCASLDQALQRRTRDLQLAMEDLRAGYQATLAALVVALDAREHETYAHSFRVRSYTALLARELAYPAAFVPQLDTAALLHDIGKIAVADQVLLKPGALTPDEFEQMKQHSNAGARIMERIEFLKPAAEIVRHHHERYDGTGYPDGLAGEAIPFGSRIFAVADALDAMTSDRCYRKALPFARAYSEILRCAGTQFDPRVAEAFRKVPESCWLGLRHQTDPPPPLI
jgi:putative nucleotidyltransferase with HDIG domain